MPAIAGKLASGCRFSRAALSSAAGSNSVGAGLAALLVGLGAYCVAIAGAHGLLNDGDTLSHIAIGRWIIAHRALPIHDPFSLTAHGQVWVPHEWLAEIVFALVHDGFGWGGVVALTGLCCAAAFALLTLELARSLSPRRAALAGLSAFLLAESHFLARPHALAWPLLVVWMAGIIGARDRGRTPPWALLLIMAVWCNLHGGFVVGLLFAALLAAEAVMTSPPAARLPTLGGWGLFLVLAGLAALVSPNGIKALLLPLDMLKMHFALASISEWRAADFSHFDPLMLWIGVIILGGFTLGLRLPLSRVLMVLLLLWMALAHVRNEELVGIIAPLLVAVPLALQLSPSGAARQPWPLPSRSAPRSWVPAASWAAALALTSAIFSASIIVLNRSGLAPTAEVAPVDALAAARRAGLTAHVFNSVRFGGYLMLEGIPTFVDGRADLFGDLFLRRYVAASDAIGGILPDLLNRYAVGWTLLEPSSPAASLLNHLPGWKLVWADPHAVIHRRTAAPQ